MIFSSVSNREKINFIKGLSVLLEGGIPINEALESLKKQTKSSVLRGAINRVKKKIEDGLSLSKACEKEKAAFDAISINLLKAGESSGNLEKNLMFLSGWMERRYILEEDVKAAMLYPKIVFAAVTLLGGWLAAFIIPKLVPFFKELRVELPWSTKLLIAMSVFIGKFWLIIGIGIVAIIILFPIINKIGKIKRFFDRLYLNVPVIGSLLMDYQLTFISELFATLIKSGLPLNETLAIISESSTNLYYKESVDHMRKRILTGINLSSAMAEYPNLYPPTIISIVAAGEKSGTFEKSFRYLADFFAQEVSQKTKRLPVVIEPLLLLVIGVAVTFIALSIISPIYDLVRSLQQ